MMNFREFEFILEDNGEIYLFLIMVGYYNFLGDFWERYWIILDL